MERQEFFHANLTQILEFVKEHLYAITRLERENENFHFMR